MKNYTLRLVATDEPGLAPFVASGPTLIAAAAALELAISQCTGGIIGEDPDFCRALTQFAEFDLGGEGEPVYKRREFSDPEADWDLHLDVRETRPAPAPLPQPTPLNPLAPILETVRRMTE